jgi:hypothetical protein
LHILKEKTKKICCQKSKIKLAAKFKMAARTKLAYVAKKTLVRLRTFGLEKNKKIFGSSKIKNGREK